MAIKIEEFHPGGQRVGTTGSQTARGRARVHAFPNTPDRASFSDRGSASPGDDSAYRAELLCRLREGVRTGTYLPDVRQLALSLLLDDRLPLVEG